MFLFVTPKTWGFRVSDLTKIFRWVGEVQPPTSQKPLKTIIPEIHHISTIAKPGAKARKVARCMKISNDPPRSKPEAKIAGSWVGWLVGFQKERNIASNTCWLGFLVGLID